MNLEPMNIGFMQMKNILFIKQSLYFLVTGTLAVSLDFVVYLILLENLGTVFSKLCGFYCGVFLSFYLNASFTFKNNNNNNNLINFKNFKKYLFILTISMLINNIINYVFIIILHEVLYAIYIAFVLATVASLIFNFLMMKFWIFR